MNGIIATTNAVEPMCIDSLPEGIKSKAYIGVKTMNESNEFYREEIAFVHRNHTPLPLILRRI